MFIYLFIFAASGAASVYWPHRSLSWARSWLLSPFAPPRFPSLNCIFVCWPLIISLSRCRLAVCLFVFFWQTCNMQQQQRQQRLPFFGTVPNGQFHFLLLQIFFKIFGAMVFMLFKEFFKREKVLQRSLILERQRIFVFFYFFKSYNDIINIWIFSAAFRWFFSTKLPQKI